MSFKNIHPLWHSAETFSIVEAAAVITGYNPHAVEPNSAKYFEDFETGITDSAGIAEVQTAIALLSRAINTGKLKSRLAPEPWKPGTPKTSTEPSHELWLDRADLIKWLESIGCFPAFFFPDTPANSQTPATHEPDYLNPDHPRYAPKLAAAVRAWQAVTDPRAKSPKQAVIKWLMDHAVEFGLLKEDGTPAVTAIAEVAKVANWNQEGGPPKPPGG